MAMSNVKYPQDTYTLALILDSLNSLIYMLSDSKSKPKSLYDLLMGRDKAKKNDKSNHRVYGSPEEFMQARNEILKKGGQ